MVDPLIRTLWGRTEWMRWLQQVGSFHGLDSGGHEGVQVVTGSQARESGHALLLHSESWVRGAAIQQGPCPWHKT